MEGMLQQEGAGPARPLADADVHSASHWKSRTSTPGQFANPTKHDKSLQPATASTSPYFANPNSATSPPITLPPDASTPATTMPIESQPMTAASSSSSSLPAQTGSGQNDGVAPSPYGTRSRNRTSNHRPNYAEDHDVDAEDDSPSNKSSQNPSVAGGSAHTGETDKSVSSTRRRSVQGVIRANTPKGSGPSAVSSKDHIPGMSSFLVNADTTTAVPPQTKKRKAPGSQVAANSTSGVTSAATLHRTLSHPNSSSTSSRETNMLTFETSQGIVKHGKLTADDGTRLAPNDHVYLVCEPPGDPYYIARIMEFIRSGNNPNSPVESVRINWVYRPRDISRKVNDTRLVFATMHSEICPLTSLRGKCQVLHRDRIPSLDDYRKMKNCFYFSQVFDRYMRRFYDVIPTSQVTNVPERVKKVLDERWQYVLVEAGRGKELTSAIKSCKRCAGYCASNDSVDCAMCKNTYHMNCVRPPLPKKPARGFAWSCGPCSRKQERKLQERNTPLVGEKALDGEEEEEFVDEEEEEHGASNETSGNSPVGSSAEGDIRPATSEQIAQAKLWPYRYLGIHCKVEDVLDYDDRIYPRAISRLGPRHQANVLVWHGRPLEFVKPAESKRKYMKGGYHKKDTKPAKDTATLEAEKIAREKRPKWVIDEPPGFVHRGNDHPNNDPANTAKTCFRLPEVGTPSTRGEDSRDSADPKPTDFERVTDEYMQQARELAPSLGVYEWSTNYLDKALNLLYENNFNAALALENLQTIDPRKDLKEPRLNKEEIKRFEEGVQLHGSNLRDVTRHIGKPQKHGDIVRYYYIWKKTERGKQIWGNFEGRKSKKYGNKADTALMDDVADDYDDSAFDNDKAAARKRGFECKFCFTRHSRYWRRAPQTGGPVTVPIDPGTKGSKDKGAHLMVALCQRCAGLWRRYAIQWENIDEVAKKVAQAGGRAWKRKMDEELLNELVQANAASSIGMSSNAVAAAASVGIDVPTSMTIQPGQEPTRKKIKIGTDKDSSLQLPVAAAIETTKKKVVEKPPEPPLIPEQPRFLTLPCFVCNEMEPIGEELFRCRHCRLTVHRNCYGIPQGRTASKWTCDMCTNDANYQVSTSYECRLCPVRYRHWELFEPPKASHKKKTDREREKERLEKELVAEATAHFNKRQDEMGWPIYPREPLKKTAGNNWVHVTCAVWMPWVKFERPEALEIVEGLRSIPPENYRQMCTLCKTTTGACITCHKCPATFHVSCAQQAGYLMGFDVTPVKGSRRDVISSITLGTESGNVEAVIYCKEHVPKTILHPMHEAAEPPLNALQLFVRAFKQADLSLTGTVRKASVINSFIKPIPQPIVVNGHRSSITNASGNGIDTPHPRSSRVSPAAVTVKSEEVDEDGDRVVRLNESDASEPNTKECSSCSTRISPKWHYNSNAMAQKSESSSRSPEQQLINGHDPGTVTNDIYELSRDYLCHRCYVRKRKEPSPEVSIVSSERPQQVTHRVAEEVEAAESHPPAPTPWLATPSIPPAHSESHLSQPPKPIDSIAHLANGVSHSPPQQMAANPQTSFAAAPGHFYGPSFEPRDQHHGIQHRHHMNGASPQYPVSRILPSSTDQTPFSAPPQNLGAVQFGRPLSNGNQAPSNPYLAAQAPPGPQLRPPLGPPRAEENPFLIPHHTPNDPYTSPRQLYQGTQGSPRHRAPHLRPETPTDGSGRNTAWTGSEGSMANGASASPSLRNLLH